MCVLYQFSLRHDVCVTFQYIDSDFLYFSKFFWNYVFKYLFSIIMIVFLVSSYSYIEYPVFLYLLFLLCLFLYFYFTFSVLFLIFCCFLEMPFLSSISSNFNCTSMIFLFFQVFPKLSKFILYYIIFIIYPSFTWALYSSVVPFFTIELFLFKIYSKRFNHNFHSLCSNIFVRGFFFFFWSNSFSCNILPLFCTFFIDLCSFPL